MGINVSRVKIDNLHVNNYNDSSDSEDEIQNNFSELIDNSTNVNQLIDIYYEYYDIKYYLKYPEFATNKLGLDKKHLENLPNFEERTRENVKQWFIDSKITFEQIIFTGW
jgi:hypothetical protein